MRERSLLSRRSASFDAPANWIYSCAQREFFVSLTFSLSHRIQGSENFFRKALAPKSLKGPPRAIFAHIMEYGDNTLFGRCQVHHHAQRMQDVWCASDQCRSCPPRARLRRPRDTRWRWPRAAVPGVAIGGLGAALGRALPGTGWRRAVSTAAAAGIIAFGMDGLFVP